MEENAPWPRSFDELDQDEGIRRWRAELLERHGVGWFSTGADSVDIEPALARWALESAPERGDTLVNRNIRSREAAIDVLLNHWDHQQRSRAARVLGSQGDDSAIPALVIALGDTHPAVTSAAGGALWRIGSPAVVQALMHLVAQSDRREARREALDVLRRLGRPEAAPAIQIALDDPDAGIRIHAAMASRQIHSSELEAAVWRAAVDDDDERVRGEAVYALGELAKVGKVLVDESMLTSLLTDPSLFVRRAGALALAKAGVTSAAEQLEHLAGSDPEEEVRRAASAALEVLVDPAPE